MSIIFLFLNLPRTILEWIVYCLLVLAYSFLVIEGFRLKKAERKFKGLKELRIIALIILIWYGLRVFVPFIETINPTIFEISFVAFYTTTTYLIFQSGIFLLILGIGFIIFGHKNHESSGVLILIAGIIYLVSSLFNITFSAFVELPLIQSLSWIIRSLFLTSTIIILIYSILIKRLFFITFSTLFMVAEIISFFMFFGNL